MKKITKIILIASLGIFSLCNTTINAQNVNIPDSNFKATLVANLSINTNGDTEIQVSEATIFNGTLNACYKRISDLTGIEAFTALHILSCCGNTLNNLDVSKNTALTVLECYSNSLNSLDVTKNIALTNLDCSSNSISSLDVTKNIALTYLSCGFNSLSSLDVSKNIALTDLFCSHNSLNSLDVSKNIPLTILSCGTNSISSLDVSKNTALELLSCYSNSISSLDVSKNSTLFGLECYNNSLSSLNLANGNNKNKYLTLYANSNPNLTCIQVDNVAYSTANWTVVNLSIDAIASFSLNCPILGINEPSLSQLISIYPNTTSGKVILVGDNINSIEIYNILGEKVLQQKSTKEIDFSKSPKGIYFVKINDGTKTYCKKIIVQ